MRRCLVTGTDTGVGKTVFCGLWARTLAARGLLVRYVKPVQTGFPAEDDASVVRELSGLGPDRAGVLFTHPEPVAPAFVFDPFPFDQAVDLVNGARDADVVLVETAGGLLAPLDERRSNADFVRACGLEVVLVVPNRLGCLNHARLNHAYLVREGLPLSGLALNDHFAADPAFAASNREWLDRLLPGTIRYLFDDSGLVEVGG